VNLQKAKEEANDTFLMTTQHLFTSEILGEIPVTFYFSFFGGTGV
jgi:hypothetical protein